MDTEWSFMTVIMEIARTEGFGGMTAQERSALAEQFGISELRTRVVDPFGRRT